MKNQLHILTLMLMIIVSGVLVVVVCHHHDKVSFNISCTTSLLESKTIETPGPG